MAQTVAAPSVRAMWQWYAGLIVSAPHTLLAFATTHQVNVIYLQVSPSIPAGAYAAFISTAAHDGIKVMATNGSPTWGTAAGRGPLLAFVSWVATYNAQNPTAPFAGINLDIEPYTLAAWSTSQASVVSQWMANVQAAVSAAGSNALKVSVAVPFWLNTVSAPGAGEPLGLWMAQHTQQLVIMAYRSTEAGVVSVAAAEVNDGAAVGRPVVVAVDTTDSGAATSFYGQTQPQLSTALSSLVSQMSGQSAFAGWAVNDYAAWSVMPS